MLQPGCKAAMRAGIAALLATPSLTAFPSAPAPHDHHHHPYPYADHPLGPKTLPQIQGRRAREEQDR